MRHISLPLFAAIVVLLATHDLSGEKPHPPSKGIVLKQDIVGLWMMGQSLCDGSESLPLVTPTDPGWGNYKFKRGVRTWIYGDHCDKPSERPDEQFTFVPLTATRNGGLGETIANGLADHLKSALLASHTGTATAGATNSGAPERLALELVARSNQ